MSGLEAVGLHGQVVSAAALHDVEVVLQEHRLVGHEDVVLSRELHHIHVRDLVMDDVVAVLVLGAGSLGVHLLGHVDGSVADAVGRDRNAVILEILDHGHLFAVCDAVDALCVWVIRIAVDHHGGAGAQRAVLEHLGGAVFHQAHLSAPVFRNEFLGLLHVLAAALGHVAHWRGAVCIHVFQSRLDDLLRSDGGVVVGLGGGHAVFHGVLHGLAVVHLGVFHRHLRYCQTGFRLGCFEQIAVGFAVFAQDHFAAFDGVMVLIQAHLLQDEAVDRRRVSADTAQEYGDLGGDGIAVVLVGQTLLVRIEHVVVPGLGKDALDAGMVGDVLPPCRDHVLHALAAGEIQLGHGHAHLQDVHVGVVEAGHDGLAAAVDLLCVITCQRQDLAGGAHRFDPSVFLQDGFRENAFLYVNFRVVECCLAHRSLLLSTS